ncbi:hypothetical protein M514_07922, partial [Trichuris suis]
LGSITVSAARDSRSAKLKLLVARGSGPSLLGRNWFAPLGISLVYHLREKDRKGHIAKMKSDFAEVFQEGLGKYKGPTVSLSVLPDVEPKFMKSRPVPFALRAKADAEIRRLVKDGLLEPVADPKWTTPLVCVLKRDGSMRVCADYRATVNPAISNNVYPLLTLDEAFAALAGGKCFTRLDLRNAYLQRPVDEASSNILTVNTPLGLHRVNRLPFGLKSAPAIFQRVMVSLLMDIEGVQVLLDDILISGSSQAEHWTRVYAVLQRLKEAGLRLKSEKCIFEANEVAFLGHKISPEGISPTEDKVQAIRKAPAPQNKAELQAFLGLVNFYNRFVPYRANALAPLYQLLKDNASWKWGTEQKNAFQRIKESPPLRYLWRTTTPTDHWRSVAMPCL